MRWYNSEYGKGVEMIILKSCPICDSQNLVHPAHVSLGPKLPFEIMPAVQVDTFIINYYSMCQSCSLIFQNPRMADDELERYYSKGYYRNMVYGKREGADNFEIRRAEIDSEIIKSYMGKVASHLDIGCSRGYLLDALGAGTKIGVEPYGSYVKVSGIKVYSKVSMVPPKLFDLVTVIHVLEHVSDPLSLLQTAVKFVDKDGYLVIEVPAAEMKDGKKKLSLDFVHLFHFELDVLNRLCRQVGLRILHIHFTPHTLLICKK